MRTSGHLKDRNILTLLFAKLGGLVGVVTFFSIRMGVTLLTNDQHRHHTGTTTGHHTGTTTGHHHWPPPLHHHGHHTGTTTPLPVFRLSPFPFPLKRPTLILTNDQPTRPFGHLKTEKTKSPSPLPLSSRCSAFSAFPLSSEKNLTNKPRKKTLPTDPRL